MKKKASKVAIYGGLGNQMFQYCLYLYLKSNNKNVDISISNYFLQSHHSGFDLVRAFNIKLSIKNRLEYFILIHFNSILKNKHITFFFGKIIPPLQKFGLDIYSEKKEFVMDSNILSLHSVYLKGTWQSLLYLNTTRNVILKEFEFVLPTDKQNKEIIALIRQTDSVSIHIRRGDYLSQQWADTHHVIKSIDYYQQAIQLIKNKVNRPYFFIFSNDIEWSQKTFSDLSNTTFVNCNTKEKSYLDMYCMSICKHNIIANSTFSWWGAWLNQNGNKIVIAPNKWINGIDCSELMPDNWTLIKV